ncbi:MAG: hypothetical protein Q4F72_12865 [Desulfovibrionaceae bacterium]|nr:hypothetical protein [Desulfovibrionaceae bacterium]
MDRLVLTLFIIFVSLAAGYLFQMLWRTGRIAVTETMALSLRLNLQKIAMFGLIPLSAMLSLWGLASPDSRLLALPVLGVLAWIAGGILAIALSRLMRLDNAQTGSMYCCGTFTNIGAVGTLVCVMNFGEQAIAYTSLYRLCEELFYFGVAYPVVQWFSSARTGRFTLSGFRLQPVLKVVLLALGLGLALNMLSVPRPAVFGTLASGAMLAGTVFFLLAIGMSLRLSRVTCYLPHSAAISLIKFLLVPCIVTALAMFTGLKNIDGGLPLRVVFILSAMPVAMNALVPPSLFGLDVDLANATWIVTTLALVIVLPVILLVLPLL